MLLSHLRSLALPGLIFLLQTTTICKKNKIALGLVVLFEGQKESSNEIPTALLATNEFSIPILMYDTTQASSRLPHTQWKHFMHTAENIIIYEQARESTTPFESALSRAKELFSDVDFFLVIDATWYIEEIDKLVEFCQKQLQQYPNPIDGPQCYTLIVADNTMHYKVPCLFRNSSGSVLQNMRVYSLFSETAIIVPNPIRIRTDQAYQPILYRTSLRHEVDEIDIKKEYRENKQSPSYIFSLAQRMEAEDHAPQARELYLKRTKMGNPRDECTWYAYYKAAVLTEQLSSNPESKLSWEDALDLYRKAYLLRATRAEPLMRIALHYAYLHEYEVAYEYAIQARGIPIPDQEYLPVETYLYTQARDWLLSACALLVGDYHSGYSATKKALEADPYNTNLRRSLAQYRRLLHA